VRRKKKKSKFWSWFYFIGIIFFSIIIGICIAGFALRYFSNIHTPLLFNKRVVSSEKIILNANVVDALNRLYYENPEKEFAVCLDGEFNSDGELVISSYGWLEPKFSNATRFTFQAYDILFCKGKGILHSHPGTNGEVCYFSATDYHTWGASFKVVNGIQCGIDKFVFEKAGKIGEHMMVRVE